MKYRIKQYLGLLLVVVLGLASLSACANKQDAVKVDCKSNVAAQLKDANSNLEKANSKLKDTKGKPSEKSAQKNVDKAQANLDALNKCSKPTAKPAASCPNSWAMKASLPANGDWVPEVPSIKPGISKAEARAAAQDWVNLTKTQPATLTAAAVALHVLPFDHSVKQASLVKDGCATQKAVQLAKANLNTVMASKVVSASAPKDGTNSGTKNGDVHYYGKPGVGGDRTAIKLVLPDKTELWVMHRCGNVVTHNPPPPATCKENGTCQPPFCKKHPTDRQCLTPKDPPKDVNVNPKVPPGVRGPGTTPVGTDPGPPTTPHDGGTGCGGPCPGSGPTSPSTPNPPPTHSTPLDPDPPATGNPGPPPSD